jgi:hypothetical protein
MGLFDSLTVKKKLPLTKELKALNIDWESEVFQTKDLENLLDTYEITKSGKLKHLWQEREWVKEEDGFFGGYLNVVREEWRDVDFHGTINFYTTHTDNDSYNWDFMCDDPEQMTWEEIDEIVGNDWWIEFEAYFTKGKLDEIKLIKASKEPIKDRIKNNKEWAEKRAIEAKKLSNRIVSFMRKFSWYRNLIRHTIRFVNWTYTKITYRLYRL